MAWRLPLPHSPPSAWTVAHERLALETDEPQQFIDITERVRGCVRLLDDLGRVLAGWAPAHARYAHDDFDRRTANMTPDERPNGQAHARAMALQASTTLALIGGSVQLGRWQRSFLVELDGPRQREMVVATAGLVATGPPAGPAPRPLLPEIVGEPA